MYLLVKQSIISGAMLTKVLIFYIRKKKFSSDWADTQVRWAFIIHARLENFMEKNDFRKSVLCNYRKKEEEKRIHKEEA